MIFDKIILNEERNVSLTVICQDVGGEFGNEVLNRPAIIVLPGGGYSMCSDREAEPVALEYLSKGFQTFVLRYTLKDKGNWPLPLNDYEQAYELIEKNKDKWHVDMNKIVVIGFSAGGHLAASIATMSKHRPNLAVLGYPATLPDISKACLSLAPSPIEYIDKNTCPCFMFASANDPIVDIKNTIDFSRRLSDFGISFESHIYSHGGHGYSTTKEYLRQTGPLPVRTFDWVKDSIEWIEELLGKNVSFKFEPPKINKFKNGNFDEFLSVKCSLSYLYDYSDEVSLILYDIKKAIDMVVSTKADKKKFVELIGGITLEEIMASIGLNDKIEEINNKLKSIKNEIQ